jgi:putative restriction endonuclease
MARRNWTRDELIVAFNLYCKLPFGQYHRRNPQVIELARLLSRTPDAVAMKLCNFASLDPTHQKRGVRGLGNSGKLDPQIWEEFNNNWEQLAIESERPFSSSKESNQNRRSWKRAICQTKQKKCFHPRPAKPRKNV